MSQEQQLVQEPRVPLSDAEYQKRAEQEGASRAERLERLGNYVDELFPGESNESLRTQIRESFDVPQWGEFHNEGLLMDTHLNLIIERIEAICGDEATSQDALQGVESVVAERIRRAVRSDRETTLRYALLHDVEKRNTLGFNKKNDKGKRETQNVAWAEWQQIFAEHPDPTSLRTHFQSLGIDGIGYIEHGDKGAEVVSAYGVDSRIAKGIRFHELGFQKDVKTGKIRSRGAVDEGDIDFIVAVNFLDQSSSHGKDGEANTKAMLRVERMLYNIGIMQDIETLQKSADLSAYDAEDVAKTVQKLEGRSDANERLGDVVTEWGKIREMHKLKKVSGEILAQQMIEIAGKKGLVLDEVTIIAIRTALEDPARRSQPEKVGSKTIFQLVLDKKMATQVNGVFLEALIEAIVP